jgi:hypothetical protein
VNYVTIGNNYVTILQFLPLIFSPQNIRKQPNQLNNLATIYTDVTRNELAICTILINSRLLFGEFYQIFKEEWKEHIYMNPNMPAV